MTVDYKKFFKATDPSKTLQADSEEDKKYYIDFSEVRGGQVVEDLKDNISLFSDGHPTCQLFTGHIGCGKSTEILQLKQKLESEGFHVVYFESSQDMEMGDVDLSDILLAIARRVVESLEEIKVKTEAKGFRAMLNGAVKILQTEIDLSAEVDVPGLGKVEANTSGEFSLSLGIGKLSAKTKDSPDMRSKLRGYMEPKTNGLLDLINQEILLPAIADLKKIGKEGLVVIVDNLDRVDDSPKPWGRPQTEYLFVDRAEQLRKLQCHLVYTMPLALRFSRDYSTLTARFMTDPIVLPMVPVVRRDGNSHEEGLTLLRQMILARVMPDQSPEARLQAIELVFDNIATLDRLCFASGGHVRNIMRLLNDALRKQRGLPVTLPVIEETIRKRRNELVLAIDDDEWKLLRQVHLTKKVVGDEGYQTLIRSMYVYEYQDENGSWFEVNPILTTAPEFLG
ncbi:MAG: AAA family ATPase [Pseudanabaenaceae cyanobacterium bins.39]|nr:AAA family ATPase [Pseudanabaenaceae cyanobacterium bins.39]